MTPECEYSLDSIKAKGNQIFNPSFFGTYSFEYAFRLLLVYLSTNRGAIRDIRSSEPNAFDVLFKEDLLHAVSYILDYRGISSSEDTSNKLTDKANEALVLYIKSSMSSAPQKVAKTLAKSMDKAVLTCLDSNTRSLGYKVFEEE